MKNKNYKFFKKATLFSFVFLFLFFYLFLFVASAQEPCETKYPDDGQCKPECAESESADDTAGLCSTGKCCHQYAQPAELNLQVPLFGYTKASDLGEYIINIYNYSLVVLVPIAIVIIIWAGFKWILSAGDSTKIQEAKKYIIGAVTGLVIAFLSYTILSLLGLTQINSPQVNYVEPMPIPVLDGEFAQTDTFNEGVSSGAPPVAGTMPRIFQCDYRSVKFNCSSKTVCSSGCGTVSATMVLRYYGKNVSVQQAVQDMASFKAIGCSVSGTSPTGFKKIADKYGLEYHTVSITFETIKNYVASGKPIIANVGNPAGCKKTPRTCKFTGCGHYIVLSGWDAANNRFIVNDPGGRASNRYNGTWNDLTKSCLFKGAYYIGN